MPDPEARSALCAARRQPGGAPAVRWRVPGGTPMGREGQRHDGRTGNGQMSWGSQLGDTQGQRRLCQALACLPAPASPVVDAQGIKDKLHPVLLPQLLSVLTDYARHVLDVT